MTGPVTGSIPGGQISLGFSMTSSGSWLKYTYSERPALSATFDSPLSEAQINERVVYPLQNLMTFVSGRPQEVEEVHLQRHDSPEMMTANPEIRLIGERVFPEGEDEHREEVYPPQMLFTIQDLEMGFAPFVERWLRLAAHYIDAFSIYFGLQYGPPVYLDYTFLGMAEAVALYYTRREDGVGHRSEEERRRKEVLSKLPDGDRDWLREHLLPDPFPPFQLVLDKLLSENAELMDPLFKTEKWGFIREVMGTFIYIIHRDPPAHRIVNFGAELHWMTAKLRILLQLCFLRELGFTADRVRSFLARDRNYQYLVKVTSSQRK
jgi:ApeA N-terminal domain 1